MSDEEHSEEFEARRDRLVEKLQQIINETLQFLRETKPRANAPKGYTTADVATALLGRHRGSLDRLVDKGRIRTVQDNWRVYYRIKDLMKQVEIHALQEKIDKLREPGNDNE